MERRYTTPDGYRRLAALIAQTRARYNEVCQSNEEAAGAGDSSVWHDNFAYEENQRQMHQLARRVRDLENLLASIMVVDPPREDPPAVCLGAVVELAVFPDPETEEPSEVLTWTIAGYEDGDPKEGRISYNSPLGSRLMGKEVGEEVSLHINREAKVAEIVSIEAPRREPPRAGSTGAAGDERPEVEPPTAGGEGGVTP